MIVFDLFDNWSKKYKKSIDCSNPKGFSQKAHCAGRKARQAGKTTKSKSINEAAYTLMDGFERLLPLAVKHLNLPSLPKIHLNKEQSGTHQASFGGYNSETDEINLTISNRHPVDILRTLAHELVHYKQKLDGKLDNDSWKTGSDAENEANAEAGVIMRDFNKQNPQFMGVPPILEHISKQGNKYVVYSKDRKRKFGTYTNREDAEKRLRQIEMFKHMNEMSHREAEKILKKHHYHLDRTHGGHDIYKDEEGHSFALPHKHHGKDLSKGVEHELRKEVSHMEESADPILDFINEKNKTFELSYGNCGMLAIALHEKFNMDHFLIVENPLHPERAYHVAAEKNGKIYDASGIITKEDLWWKGYDEESEEDPEIVELDADESFYRYIGRATDANIKPEDLLAENFADGKVKGKSRPGRVKQAGASCKGSVTDLRAKAKKYGGEKGKMYHWCANMKGSKK